MWFDIRRALAMGVAAWFCSQAQGADAPAAPAPTASGVPPVSQFFSPPRMTRPVMSPSGNHVAVTIAEPGSDRVLLAVINLNPPRDAKLVAGYSDADIVGVQWVNDDRLVFSLYDMQSTYGEQFNSPGLYAVDRTGENLRPLIQNKYMGGVVTGSHIKTRELPFNHRLLHVLRDGSADVVIQRLNYDNQFDVVDTTPMRLDTTTGLAVPLETGGLKRIIDWGVDDKGQVVVAALHEKGMSTVSWRPGSGQPWTEISKFPTFGAAKGAFHLHDIGPDGTLYAVASRGDAAGTSAVFRYDLAQRKIESRPIVALDGFDFHGRLLFDLKSRKLIGVTYTSDAQGTAWLDPDLKALQDRIDARLTSTVNLLSIPECGCSSHVIVTAFSDRQPAVYLLYDSKTDRLEPIGQQRPDVDPRQMARTDFQRIKARDGLEFPLYVTRPSGKGPWPTVVLVHGGPWVRGNEWRWSAESQFLASRGYLVVEPEFRGSEGYGARLRLAGIKQWGLKMQDDVADAARWAVAQGLADSRRMCIAGASYGGYSTLMGLIRDPDLYRCGVAWAAVTDIQLWYDLGSNWSDSSDMWKQYGMPELIGDPVKDAAQLEATSPLKQAARIKQPLLLAFGDADRRVPIVHGTRFYDEVRKTNSQVEWVDYPNEGHGFFKPANRYDFYTRMEKFLARNLQPN